MHSPGDTEQPDFFYCCRSHGRELALAFGAEWCNLVGTLAFEWIDSNEIPGIWPLFINKLATCTNSRVVQLTVLIIMIYQKKSLGVEDQRSSVEGTLRPKTLSGKPCCNTEARTAQSCDCCLNAAQRQAQSGKAPRCCLIWPRSPVISCQTRA